MPYGMVCTSDVICIKLIFMKHLEQCLLHSNHCAFLKWHIKTTEYDALVKNDNINLCLFAFELVRVYR